MQYFVLDDMAATTGSVSRDLMPPAGGRCPPRAFGQGSARSFAEIAPLERFPGARNPPEYFQQDEGAGDQTEAKQAMAGP